MAVAFSDVVASTELWSTLGDARADDVRRRLRAASESAVAAVGGVIVKVLGDGFMVSFATASSSIDGAVALQRAAESVARSTGVTDLRLRVGVSIGEAIHDGDDWFGLPVVEAARLCADAAPTQILVADSVVSLARQSKHEVHPLGNRHLKGLPEPLAVSEVIWTTRAAADSTLPNFLRRHEGDLPFAGRDEPMARLHAALASAAHQHFVVVSGEPGVGKTRLVAEYSATAIERGVTVLAWTHDEGRGAGANVQPRDRANGPRRRARRHRGLARGGRDRRAGQT